MNLQAEKISIAKILLDTNSEALIKQVKAILGVYKTDLWDELTGVFTRMHPPRHWEPNRFGEPMADFLGARRAADSSLPPFLEELADYAFIRFAVGAVSGDLCAFLS